MFKRSLLSPMLLLITLVILPATAFAGAVLSISSPGNNGVFVVRGTGLQQVAGMHLYISYDPATLSNPIISFEGSLLSGTPNPKRNPIEIAMVSTHAIGGTGSGVIATITFTRLGSSAGIITKLDANLIDVNYTKINFLPVIKNPTTASDAQNGDTDKDKETTQPPPAITGGTYAVGGTLTFPPSDTAVNEKKEAPAAPKEAVEHPVVARDFPVPATVAAEDKEPAPKPAAQPEPAPQPIQSVLERFRLFQGERTAKNLATLFNRESAASFSQEPAIAVADGKANVKLVITKVAGEKTPNFAFTSARYVSLTRFDDGEWEIEVKPDAGAVRASVSMLSNGTVQEFPLTVTPKAEVLLRKAGEVSEADFLLYLKELGTAAAPKYDLNGDGKRDYQDDYIFTANYLLKMEEKANKKQKP